MPAISNDWAAELKPEYKKEYYKELFNMPQERSFLLPMIYSMRSI